MTNHKNNPADLLAYTTEHVEPQPLCYRHVYERRRDGTIVVKDAVRIEGQGRACADCET